MKRAMLALGSAFVLLSASDARAATICVAPPAITTCPNHTIQAGVDAAAGGDIVKISPGVYYEAVDVPAGKDNLQIIGTSKTATIIDADVPNAGSYPILVLSNGVTIANLGIRNGTEGINAIGNSQIVTGVRVVGVHGTVHSAIAVQGNGAQILNNEVRGCSGSGIFLLGNSGVVKANTVAQVAGAGILVSGDLNQVVSNKLASTGFSSPYYGIQVTPGAVGKNVVSMNVLENIGNSGSNAIGLYVADPTPTVQSNKLSWAGEVRVLCAPCQGGAVTSNSLVGSSARGFFVAAGTAALPLVQGNKAGATARQAFDINGPTALASGSGTQVTQNAAAETAYPSHCFSVTGSGHTLTSNGALNCGGAGFYSKGDNILFASNQAKGATSSGFVVDGDNGANPPHFGVTLNTNKATGSLGQGFALYDGANAGHFPVGTTGSGNTGSLNRQDFCNEGAATTIGSFATTSMTCDIRY